MACTFTMRVTGLVDQVRAFRVGVEKKVEKITTGPFSGEYVVHLLPEIWGKLLFHRFFWGQPWDYGNAHKCYRAESSFVRPTDEGLEIKGECKWAPPLEFVSRAMERFPGLEFDVTSTTEHELYEHWIGKDGEVRQSEEQLVNIQTEETERWIKDGEVLIDEHPDRNV